MRGGQDAETSLWYTAREIEPGELYISAQGAESKNSGLYILRPGGRTAGLYSFGRMPTDILFDSKRHLLYVADFGKGEPSIAGGGNSLRLKRTKTDYCLCEKSR